MSQEPASPREKLLQMLRSEIRPGLQDSNPQRRRRFRMQEQVAVSILQGSPGAELNQIRSRISCMARSRPWGPVLQKMRRFQGGTVFIMDEDDGDSGQLRWDLTAGVQSIPEGQLSFREECGMIQRVLQIFKYRPELTADAKTKCDELLFLIHLHERLTRS